MQDLFKSGESCLNVVSKLVVFLKERRETTLAQIDKQQSIIDVAMNVCPALESMLTEYLIELVMQVAATAKVVLDVYDREDITLKKFFKICNKYTNNKLLGEKLIELNKAFMPIDPNLFMRRKKITL